MNRPSAGTVFGFIVSLLAVAGLAVGITLIVQDDNRHVVACHAAGGHVKDLSRDTLCLSPDNRIIDSW